MFCGNQKTLIAEDEQEVGTGYESDVIVRARRGSPGQIAREGSEQIEKTPRHDDVVVNTDEDFEESRSDAES